MRVYVAIYFFLISEFPPSCVTGELRLVGPTELEGRIEICVNETWGRICDDSFDEYDATVACSQLGLSGNPIVVLNPIMTHHSKLVIFKMLMVINTSFIFQCDTF